MWRTGFPEAGTPDVCLSLSALRLWMSGNGIRGECHHPAISLVFLVYSAFVCSQVLRQRPFLWPFVLQSESLDQEEHFVDVDDGVEADGIKKEVERQDEGDIVPALGELSQQTYMINHREPLYSKAETSCLWELAMVGQSPWPCPKSLTDYLPLQAVVHYHPSVQVFAKTLAKVTWCVVSNLLTNLCYFYREKLSITQVTHFKTSPSPTS